MFNWILKKRKYLDCPLMKNSLHFFYDEIRACCSNVKGPIFYRNFNKDKIDWKYIFEERQKIFNDIKNKKDYIPQCCNGCCEKDLYLSDKKPNEFLNKIDKIYFHNHMSCNAQCTYCAYFNHGKGYGYDAIEYVKELIDKEILSKNALIYMSGGEITISNEFEDLLSLLLSYLDSSIEILTSGIKYCKSIENAFIQNKCRLVISLDSGTREIYNKIKQVDCFDKVIKNIKSYVEASDNAKSNITLKYIIVDNINDNEKEIESFLSVVKELGIINVRLDFDFEKYKFTNETSVPKYYIKLFNYFNKSASDKGLKVSMCNQIEAILKKSKLL